MNQNMFESFIFNFEIKQYINLNSTLKNKGIDLSDYLRAELD